MFDLDSLFSEAIAEVKYLSFTDEQLKLLRMGINVYRKYHDSYLSDSGREDDDGYSSVAFNDRFQEALGKRDDLDSQGRFFYYSSTCATIYKKMERKVFGDV